MVAAVFVACTLALSIGASGSAPLDPLAFHVRATDASTREWLRIGAAESPTFRALLAKLVVSDVIVYIGVVEQIAGGLSGQMLFVAATPGTRYVRVEIVANGSEREMVALVGHELQHAVEIASAPHVRDGQSMAMLYLAMGGNRRSSRFDSLAARVTEERVRSELAGFRGPEPIQ